MSNEEFQTTTQIQSQNPAADVAVLGANTVLGGLFGLNPNVEEARGFMIARTTTGQHVAAIVDYQVARETPLVVTERTVAEAVYGRLSESFDRLNGAIE